MNLLGKLLDICGKAYFSRVTNLSKQLEKLKKMPLGSVNDVHSRIFYHFKAAYFFIVRG